MNSLFGVLFIRQPSPSLTATIAIYVNSCVAQRKKMQGISKSAHQVPSSFVLENKRYCSIGVSSTFANSI